MEHKNVGILVIFVGITCFLAGKDLSPVRIETKVIEIQTERSASIVDQLEDSVETTKTTQKPDGTIQKTTKTIRKLQKTDAKLKESQKLTQQELLQTRSDRSVGLHALWVSPLFGRTGYGALVTVPILGPIDLGVWGLTNKSFGLSIGVNF